MFSKKIAILFFLIGLIATGMSGCEEATPTPASGSANRRGPTPTPVPTLVSYEKSVFTVERGTIVSEKAISGEIVPSIQDALFFRQAGFISRISVKAGDKVKKGDLLAELQVDDLLNQLQQALIDLEVAQANFERDLAQRKYAVEKAQIDINILKAKVDLARVDWETSGGVNKVKAQLNLEIAEQSLTAAELVLKQAQEQVVSSTSGQTVERQKLAVDRLKGLLAEKRIIAPYDGVILRVTIMEGKQAIAFNTAMEIGDPTNLVVRTQLDWNLRELMSRDTEVQLSSSPTAPEKYAIKYTPDFVPFANPDSSKQQSIGPEYMYFTAPANLPPDQLKVGKSVSLNVVIGRKTDVLLLPPAALRNYRGLDFVIVLDGDKRRRVEIYKIGLKTSERVEVTADLQEGERVLGQ